MPVLSRRALLIGASPGAGGTKIEAGPEPGPGAPTIRIRSFAIVGGTRIHRSGHG